MTDFSNVNIQSLIIHKVGNKAIDEHLVLSNQCIDIEDNELNQILLKFFLNSFKDKDFYRFTHTSDLNLNTMYTYCSEIFDNLNTFTENSKNIAKYLYEKSSHPKMKGGELCITYFTECVIGDEIVDAIGIFKSENKDIFLHFLDSQDNMSVNYQYGINPKNLDKGCLVLNTYKEEGYKILVVDTKSSETLYWKEDFLGIDNHEDDNYKTKMQMDLCKKFSTELATKNCDKRDQIDFVSKSINYFNNNEVFNEESFINEVIEKPELKQEFKDYVQTYKQDMDIDMEEMNNFEISKPAVKTMKRKFKNLIKLDSRIEIKINTSESESSHFIEKGYDEAMGMNYYKLYFNEES